MKANEIEILDHFKDSIWKSKKRFIVEQGGAGSGKAVSSKTKVVTPNGYTLMEDLRVGDDICNTYGGVSKVVGKYDNGLMTMYRFTFEDGRECVASGDHIWKVCYTYPDEGFDGGDEYFEATTSEIMSLMEKYGDCISIPLAEPVFFNKAVGLEIDSYRFGCIVSNIDNCGYENILNGAEKEYLQKNGLDITKQNDLFIPDCYKYASINQRYDLLNGILGTNCKDDCLEDNMFVFITERLAEDVAWVIRSLGGKATVVDVTEEDIKTYILYYDLCLDKKAYNLEIESIEQCGTDICYCIAVNAEDLLYLVDDFVVTHNTHAIIQRLCYIFMTQGNVRITIVRATMPALKRSVYLGSPSFNEMLSAWGVPMMEWLNKSEAKITNAENGSVIEFVGLDNAEKIKSMNTNYIFIEEATELTAEKWRQLDTRMRRDNPYGPNQMFIAYNPISYNNWVVQTFVVNPDDVIKEQTNVHFSNFTQNNHTSLNNVKTWLANASHNEEYYRTYILGIPGTPKGQIYTNFKFSPKDMWPEEVWDVKPYYGIDWGFVHPMCLVECRDYKGTTYVINRFYQSGKTTRELIEFMKGMGISSSCPIYCDSAEGDRIFELIKAGFQAHKAMKSVHAGITHLKGCNIVVDISDQNGESALKETQSYTWKKDPENEDFFLEVPIKENDDFCDSVRYGIFTAHMKEMEFSVGKLDLSGYEDKLTQMGMVLSPEEKGNKYNTLPI